MFSFRTTPLEEQGDLVLMRGRVGVLCNHVAWNPDRGEYLFETLHRRGNLKKVFVPKDGLFCELYDGFGGVRYSSMGLDGCDFIYLGGNSDTAFSSQLDNLKELDALVIEFQEVGVRYGEYISLLYNLFKTVHENDLTLSIYILDRENPTGRQVEGTMLPPEFASSEGVGGLPHRHGLTLGELSNLFHSELGAKFALHIISYFVRSVTRYMMPWSITPKSGISGLFSSTFFAGQYLLSTANLSYGEGSEKPFEIFGAPYLSELSRYCHDSGVENWNDPKNPIYSTGAFMRWIHFVPRFGRYEGEKCYGFHLIPRPGVQYHSLAHSLRILRFLGDNCPDFEFEDSYDDNGLMKIDYLLGDQILFGYLNGDVEWEEIKEHIKIEEQRWIRKAKRYLLYEDQPWRVKNI